MVERAETSGWSSKPRYPRERLGGRGGLGGLGIWGSGDAQGGLGRSEEAWEGPMSEGSALLGF